jgi:Lrp/AsnC family transcriptional regulator, leucine-responsive regulatory protein
MDGIDRDLLIALLNDGRATYQSLGQQVRLAPNTVADRVRRLQSSGVLTKFRAEIDVAALGLSTTLIVDIQLGEDVNRKDFEAGLSTVPQIVSALHLTGRYDYQLRVVCADTTEFESVIEVLKHEHGVRQLESHLVLREAPLGLAGLLNRPDISTRPAQESRGLPKRPK